MSKWKDIWLSRKDTAVESQTKEEIFMELKKIDGFDVTRGITFEAQLCELIINLTFHGKSIKPWKIRSIYEVGCGCGANFYYFLNLLNASLQDRISDQLIIGCSDYSDTLIQLARKYLPAEILRECDAVEAVDMKTNQQYDAVFSNSVFSYFSDYDYAEAVLQKMLAKARHSIGILDVHDISKKDSFLEFRRSLIENYDKKYQELGKLFYPKSFFIDFAEKNNLDILFRQSDVKGYWNNPFVFNVYLYRNEECSLS